MDKLYQFGGFNEMRGIKILSRDPNSELIASSAIRVSQNTAEVETRRISTWNIRR
jgi:hypothetical protein